jgi:phage FluMu protein Com
VEEPEPQGRDPGGVLSCGHCGWQGLDLLTRVSGSSGEDSEHLAAECPRCHEPVEAGMPSFEEILAARRAPRV